MAVKKFHGTPRDGRTCCDRNTSADPELKDKGDFILDG